MSTTNLTLNEPPIGVGENTSCFLSLSVVVKTQSLGFYQKLRKSKAELSLINLKTFGPLSFMIIKNKRLLLSIDEGAKKFEIVQ